MTASDLIDERYDDLVRELRTLPGAPEELRARVLSAASAAEERRPRRSLRLPRPRLLALALVPVAAVAAVALAVGLHGSSPPTATRAEEHGGFVKSAGGGGSGKATVTVPAAQRTLRAATAPKVFGAADAARPAVSLPVTPGRLTSVTASLRLRVRGLDGLSRATANAMRITRHLGGFVASVEYGTPGNRNGDAYLTVRIPVARVQQAVVRFSGLGTILAQHVSIQDLQDAANAQAVQILRLRRTAAQLEARLRGQLTPEERVRVQSRLDAVRGLIRLRTQQHQGTVRQGRLSTFRLELTTRRGAVVAPAKPGRIERAARHAASLLAKTVAGGLYALIVLSPLLLLAAAALAATRFRRRRVEQRLLARA